MCILSNNLVVNDIILAPYLRPASPHMSCWLWYFLLSNTLWPHIRCNDYYSEWNLYHSTGTSNIIFTHSPYFPIESTLMIFSVIPCVELAVYLGFIRPNFTTRGYKWD